MFNSYYHNNFTAHKNNIKNHHTFKELNNLLKMPDKNGRFKSKLNLGDLFDVEGEVVGVELELVVLVPLANGTLFGAMVVEGTIDTVTAAAFVGGQREVGAGVDLLDQLQDIVTLGRALGGIRGETQRRAIVISVPVAMSMWSRTIG